MAEASVHSVIDGHVNPMDYTGQIGDDANTFRSSTPSVSRKYNNRRKCIYLFGGFIVSSCLAAVACAVLLMFIVLKPAVPEVEIIAESGLLSSYHAGETETQCMNTTVHRINARARYAEVGTFDALINTKFKPVCCEDIPEECKDILPYQKTNFPNKKYKSIEKAKKYLEDVASFMDCNPHSRYVFCARAYPPCATDSRPVMPCKSVCDGVLNSCRKSNASKSDIDSKLLSCDNYAVGGQDEIVCRSTSYTTVLDMGQQFSFSSPNNPKEFPPNAEVVWSFTSPEFTRIQINITGVDLNAELGEELTLQFSQNPYGRDSRYNKQDITKDRVIITVVNFASVIFKSGKTTNGSRGFAAKITVLRAKDTLVCENNGRPIKEENLCDGVFDCTDCEEEKCRTCTGIYECFDERQCRPPCGYNMLMSTEKASEVLSSLPYSGSFEDCIYTFRTPSRFRVRLEFLDHHGLVSGCNFKYGSGDNPFNTASEFSGIPQLSKAIDLPGRFGWIWLASSSVNTTFEVRVSAFSDDLVIHLGADDTYTVDTSQGSDELVNAFERGSVTFKTPPGYHLMFRTIKGKTDLQLNNIMVGVGDEPMKSDVSIFYVHTEDVYEFFLDAFWVKLSGNGWFEIGLEVTAVPSKEGERNSVLIDTTATIVFPIPPEPQAADCPENDPAKNDAEEEEMEVVTETTYVTVSHVVDNGNEEEKGNSDTETNMVATTWIVTSVRHPMIGVKFLYLNTTSGDFNFLSIGHGLNADASSSILFSGAVTDYEHRLPEDFIIKYSTFWVRHTSSREAKKKTMFALELNGIANIDDLVCPLKFGVTKEDLCDDKYDCPDHSDERNCGDKSKCGARPLHNKRQKRVIGGSESSIGDYPWHGLILVDGYSHCGSTLLNEYIAITASHCLWHETNSASKLEIMYASISNEKFSNKHLVREVSALFLYPRDFSLSDPMDHDIALIKLKDPVTFTDTVRPACLVRNESQFPAGHQCYISGFGRQVQTELAKTLHAAPLTLFSNDKCMDFQSNLFQITDNIICAGKRDGGVGTCYGDSGGPLVCPDEDELFYLRGLTSFGHACADRYRPGAFTRIERYLPFIDKIMKSVSTDK